MYISRSRRSPSEQMHTVGKRRQGRVIPGRGPPRCRCPIFPPAVSPAAHHLSCRNSKLHRLRLFFSAARYRHPSLPVILQGFYFGGVKAVLKSLRLWMLECFRACFAVSVMPFKAHEKVITAYGGHDSLWGISLLAKGRTGNGGKIA